MSAICPQLSNPFDVTMTIRQAGRHFYWGLVDSWSPFVGMFIARVSRGRTVPVSFSSCVCSSVDRLGCSG